MGSLLSRPQILPLQATSVPQEGVQEEVLAVVPAADGADANGEKPAGVRFGTRKRKSRIRDDETDSGSTGVGSVRDSDSVSSEQSGGSSKRRKKNEAPAELLKRQFKQQKGRRKKTAEVHDMYRLIDLRLECDLCHKCFHSQAKLICHKPCFYRRKGMSVEPVQWTCEVATCRKFFNRLSVLCQHMTIHYEGSYCCKKCGVKTTRRSLIIDHIQKKHLQ